MKKCHGACIDRLVFLLQKLYWIVVLDTGTGTIESNPIKIIIYRSIILIHNVILCNLQRFQWMFIVYSNTVYPVFKFRQRIVLIQVDSPFLCTARTFYHLVINFIMKIKYLKYPFLGDACRYLLIISINWLYVGGDLGSLS